MRIKIWALSLGASLLLTACDTNREEEPIGEPAEPTETEEEVGEEEETVSILRPDVEAELEQEPLEALGLTIGFADGGAELDEAALEALAEVTASEQIGQEDWAITLRAHSDSAGSDAANMRAAEQRGLAVAAWLIERRVDPERIDVIVFGEQNPIEPNAMPDGSVNEEGRAANRRVEIEIAPKG